MDDSTLDLISQSVGVRNRTAIDRGHAPPHDDQARVLVHLDLRDHAAVAVVAFVQDAGDATAGHDSLTGARARRRASVPARLGGRGRQHLAQPRVAQMPQPVLHRIGIDTRRDFVQEGFVSERVLQASRRPQRPGEERGFNHVQQYPFAANGAGAAAHTAATPGHVRRHVVAAVFILAGGRLGHDQGDEGGHWFARGAGSAASKPTREPVTTLPGLLPPGRPPRETDQDSWSQEAIVPFASSPARSSSTYARP